MYNSEGNVEDIQASLFHIERLLQKSNRLLYGSGADSTSRGGDQAAEGLGAFLAQHVKSSIQSPGLRTGHTAELSDSSDYGSDEEKAYEEREIFFKVDALRVAKLVKQSRRERRAEARRKAILAAEVLAGRANPPPTRRGVPEEEDEEPPEKINLADVCARIHREVEEYRAICKSKEYGFFSPSRSPQKKYVSPYASTPVHQGKAIKKPEVKNTQKSLVPAKKVFSKNSKVPPSAPAPAPPPRKAREPIDHRVPIWERLYPGPTKAHNTTVKVDNHSPKPPPRFNFSRNPIPQKTTPVVRSISKKVAAAVHSGQRMAATMASRSSPGKAPQDGIRTAVKGGNVKAGISSPSKNILLQEKGGKTETPSQKKRTTVPHVSPLDLRNLM